MANMRVALGQYLAGVLVELGIDCTTGAFRGTDDGDGVFLHSLLSSAHILFALDVLFSFSSYLFIINTYTKGRESWLKLH